MVSLIYSPFTTLGLNQRFLRLLRSYLDIVSIIHISIVHIKILFTDFLKPGTADGGGGGVIWTPPVVSQKMYLLNGSKMLFFVIFNNILIFFKLFRRYEEFIFQYSLFPSSFTNFLDFLTFTKKVMRSAYNRWCQHFFYVEHALNRLFNNCIMLYLY